MKLICALIKWGIRVAFFFFVMMPTAYATKSIILLVAELIASGISLSRYESDEIFQVITGWGPFGDFGHYEYTDHTGKRVLGWLFWLGAMACRIFMIYCMANPQILLAE